MGSDVVIIGAGVIGLSAALRCADEGLGVTLLDPDPGRGASWAAAGMLAPVTELHFGETDLLRLNLRSSARWPSWAANLAERGAQIGYARCGSLQVARDQGDAAELQRMLDTQRDLGLQVSWLRSREARQLEPGLAPSVRGAILVQGDHQVDNRALVEGLVDLANAHQRIDLRRVRADQLLLDGDRISGVRTQTGICEGDVVVLAAGAHSPRLTGVPDVVAAVRPIKGQLVHLRSPSGPLARSNLRGREVYVVNRPDGRIVIGATVEELGFDTTVTAGGVSTLLRAAWEILPGVDECEFVEAIAGIRPGSIDNAPVLGRAPGIDNLILATGHFRNGVLLSPLTADVVATLAGGGQPQVDLSPFAPSRFTGARVSA